MSSPLSDGIVLADKQTDTKGIVKNDDPGGRDIASVYKSGLVNDTVVIEYRPDKDHGWAQVVDLASGSSDMQTLHNMPEGEYRLNRNGNQDTITVALI